MLVVLWGWVAGGIVVVQGVASLLVGWVEVRNDFFFFESMGAMKLPFKA